MGETYSVQEIRGKIFPVYERITQFEMDIHRATESENPEPFLEVMKKLFPIA